MNKPFQLEGLRGSVGLSRVADKLIKTFNTLQKKSGTPGVIIPQYCGCTVLNIQALIVNKRHHIQGHGTVALRSPITDYYLVKAALC